MSNPLDARARLGRLAEIISCGDVVALSGAGLSTESGIPDYRGPTGRARTITPITYQEFVSSDGARQRYWARSHLGWQHITGASPNSGHCAVANLEREGVVTATITQNVDGLHQVAGSRHVIDLHGRLDRVICLGCGASSARRALDDRLRAANADWAPRRTQVNPDGDAVIDDREVERFRTVDCDLCGGLLKPDVVFFGENVAKARVAQCYELVDGARTLLVLGSSLTVMSGYRFVRHAAKLGVTVLIVNQGATRGDALADLIVDAPLGATLTGLTDTVRVARSPSPVTA